MEEMKGEEEERVRRMNSGRMNSVIFMMIIK